MAFQPYVDQALAIGSASYRVSEHPAAPGIPYGQEGRQAIVYQLVDAEQTRQALKVFKPRFRLPELAFLAGQIAPFAELGGLEVCRRTVLVPRSHAPLLREHPDLTYAVLMPWIEGPTWMEVMFEKRALSAEQSLDMAQALVGILAEMEQRRLAHCDLSAPNVMLPALVPTPPPGGAAVALVDVEQLYAPGLAQPELLPSGSLGYAHKTAPQGLWSAIADRFSGAVLLAEMLAWCDERVREVAWGESYFEPDQVQQSSERYRVLGQALRDRWGEGVARLLERAWDSEALADCPTFGEWLVTLPIEVPTARAAQAGVSAEREESGAQEAAGTLQVLLDLARRFEAADNLPGALTTYQQARRLAPAESELAGELALIVEELRDRQAHAALPASEKEAVLPPPELVAEARPAERHEPPPPSELDGLFQDGVAAYQQEAWRQARELLAEVVRRRPDYERGGWRAQKLLADVEKRLVPRWKRFVRYSLVILGSTALVFALVCAVFATLYLAVVRPIVEETVFDTMRSALPPMIDLEPDRGCVEFSESEINAALREMAPSAVLSNQLHVQLSEGELTALGAIGEYALWVVAEIPEHEFGDANELDLGRVRANWLIQLLVSRRGLEAFVEEYVNQEILDRYDLNLAAIEVRENEIDICLF